MASTVGAQTLFHILVRDLVLNCRIGVHPHEMHAPQRVRLNIDMSVELPAGPLADDIANVMSYEDVIAGVKALLGAGHINLVETLAERVAQLCLADPRVADVRVRVEKLDVYPEAAAVGIEIVRHRSPSGAR